MGRPTEHSVAGGLIILAFTLGGAVLLAVVGGVAMSFVAHWFWLEPAGPSIPKGIDGPTWGDLSVAEWLGGVFAGPGNTTGPYAGLAKAIYVATYVLGVFLLALFWVA